MLLCIPIDVCMFFFFLFFLKKSISTRSNTRKTLLKIKSTPSSPHSSIQNKLSTFRRNVLLQEGFKKKRKKKVVSISTSLSWIPPISFQHEINIHVGKGWKRQQWKEEHLSYCGTLVLSYKMFVFENVGRLCSYLSN